MFVVGLAGGIGSGKTAVSDRFANLGIDVVDDVIVNDGDIEALDLQVEALHDRYERLAQTQ